MAGIKFDSILDEFREGDWWLWSSTIATSTTPTPNIDAFWILTITALETAASFWIPAGTPVNWKVLLIRIKDNGTARALTWNPIYRAWTDIALPLITVVWKTLYIWFMYNSTDSKRDLLAVTNNI